MGPHWFAAAKPPRGKSLKYGTEPHRLTVTFLLQLYFVLSAPLKLIRKLPCAGSGPLRPGHRHIQPCVLQDGVAAAGQLRLLLGTIPDILLCLGVLCRAVFQKEVCLQFSLKR